MAVKKPVVVNTNTGKINYSQDESGAYIFTCYRRLTRKDKKAGIAVDDKTPVITFKIDKPDEFKCSHFSVTVGGPFDEALIKEFIERIDNLVSDEEIVFFRGSVSEMGNNEVLVAALREVGFAQEDDVIEYEQKVGGNLAIWMSIGTSLGVIFGLNSSMIYLAIGIGAGMCFGSFLDAEAKKKRAALKIARGHNITETVEE